MFLGLNWIDFLIIITILTFAADALGRPFISELLDLISFILALIFSFRYYNFFGDIIQEKMGLPHGLSLALGFLMVWFLAEFLFFMAVRFLLSHHLIRLRFYKDKIFSSIPAIFRSLIFISLILVLIGSFPIQPRVKKAINESVLGSFLLKQAYGLEEPVKAVFGGVTNDTLTFLTIKPKTNEKVNLGFQTHDFKIDPAAEQQMIELVNKERTARGIKALDFVEKLREVGRVHSQDMFLRGYFSHFSPEGENVADRADKLGIKYLVIGENLAYAPNLELAHKGLMNSEGHRANILSTDFNKIGIGVMDGGVYGEMFTQVFSD